MTKVLPVLAPVKAAAVVTMWLDHPKVGCGLRQFMVLKEGPKWTKLLCIAAGSTLTIPTAQFKASRPVPFECSRTRLTRRLRAVADTYGKTPGVKAALALVR